MLWKIKSRQSFFQGENNKVESILCQGQGHIDFSNKQWLAKEMLLPQPQGTQTFSIAQFDSFRPLIGFIGRTEKAEFVRVHAPILVMYQKRVHTTIFVARRVNKVRWKQCFVFWNFSRKSSDIWRRKIENTVVQRSLTHFCNKIPLKTSLGALFVRLFSRYSGNQTCVQPRLQALRR